MFLPDKNLMPTPDVVTHAPFTLESLIAWLETKDASEEYCYLDNGDCLIGRYTKEVCGFSRPNIGDTHFSDLEADRIDRRELPIHWNAIAQGSFEVPARTFGAALTRARAYAAEAK